MAVNSTQCWLVFVVCASLSTGCGEPNVETVTSPSIIPWWQSLEPDVKIGQDDFYAGTCSITQVSHAAGIETARVIFEIPSRMLKTCENRGPLQFDGEYIILSVCEMSFGAGGCAGGRYRSADFELWEEYIGVTWINSEEHEAWRKVGSTSSKADSVKKVVRD